MNMRVALAFFCMVACGALAPPQFCLSHGVQEHVPDTSEQWVTFYSTVLHMATFAMGFIVCKWLKGYPQCPVVASKSIACTGTQFSMQDVDTEDVDRITENAFWDAPISADDSREIGTVRGFGATARNLAQIFRQELSDDESVDYEFAPPGGHCEKTAREESSQVFKHELTESTTDGDYDDDISDSDVPEKVESSARSPAHSWGPPSPPSPSREASPVQGSGPQENIGASLSEVDVDSLLLLRGMEAALTTRIRASVGKVAVPPWRRSCFHSSETCDMSIFHCLSRVHRAFQCSNPCFIIALVYMDRVSEVSRYLAVSEGTWNKLLITSIVLALKFHDDDYRPYSNSYYASAGGMDMEELNDNERQFCRLLDWKFSVQPSEYNQYYHLVFSAAACN